MAASIVLLALPFATGYLVGARPPSERAALVDDITGYHNVYARETRHLVEIAADRQDELLVWMQDRIGSSFTIPDLQAVGLSFAGGRMLVINDRPVGQLMYLARDGAPAALCVTTSTADPKPVQIAAQKGLHYAIWDNDGYTYVVVGAATADRTREIAEFVKKSL